MSDRKIMGFITIPLYFEKVGDELQMSAEGPEIDLKVTATNKAIVAALQLGSQVCAECANPEWVREMAKRISSVQ